MNQRLLILKLQALSSKRAFCKRNGLSQRTLWRMLSDKANPTQSTLDAFAYAIKADKQRSTKCK